MRVHTAAEMCLRALLSAAIGKDGQTCLHCRTAAVTIMVT
jgi:hypothetical protein